LWSVPFGPILNLTELLEDAGIVIVERPMEDEIDAVSVWGPEECPVVLLNERYPADRKRQTLAHELGHLVMHFGDVTEHPEDEAHEFAREFLMPSREILPELVGLKFAALPDLKRRWRCSMRNIVYAGVRLARGADLLAGRVPQPHPRGDRPAPERTQVLTGRRRAHCARRSGAFPIRVLPVATSTPGVTIGSPPPCERSRSAVPA
jgi:IrrE N-terminal-like domain